MGEQAKAANIIAKEGGLETTSALHDYALQLPQITTQTVTTSVVTVKALHISSCCAHVTCLDHGKRRNQHVAFLHPCSRAAYRHVHKLGIGPDKPAKEQVLHFRSLALTSSDRGFAECMPWHI